VERLAKVAPLEFLEPGAPAPTGAGTRVAAFGEVYLARPPTTAADLEALVREREKIHGILARTRVRLSDAGFRDHAPAEVVRETEAKAKELEERLRRIDEHLSAGASTRGAP